MKAGIFLNALSEIFVFEFLYSIFLRKMRLTFFFYSMARKLLS